MSHDISQFPVNKGKCATCPFRTDTRGRYPDSQLVSKVQQTALNQGSQICHHHELVGKEPSHLCRGARDFQLKIFHSLGILDTPTDDCWDKAQGQLDSR